MTWFTISLHQTSSRDFCDSILVLLAPGTTSAAQNTASACGPSGMLV